MTDAERFFIDTNVLLSATAAERALHPHALRVLNDWTNRGFTLCFSGQVMREYLVVATRDNEVNGLGLKLTSALANVDAFKSRLYFLEEDRRVLDRFLSLLAEVPSVGKPIHDAHIVSTMLAHGVTCVVTANVRDFRRFSDLISIVDLSDVWQ